MKNLLIFIFTIASISFAADYYVATDGNDSNPGTSVSPCKTVEYVLANKVHARDKIIIKPGDYPPEGKIHIDDTNDHQGITITGEDPNNRPHFLGMNENGAGFSIDEGVKNVTISNLRIRKRETNSPPATWSSCIAVKDNPATIDNCEIYNCDGGIIIYTSKGVTIKNCYIHDCGIMGSGFDAHGITPSNINNEPAATNWNEKIYIYNCTVHTCAGDCYQDTSSQDTGKENPIHYIEIENCTFYDACEQGIDSKGTCYFKVHGCTIYGNIYGGISDNSTYGPHSYWWIYNNTIYDHKNFAIFAQGNDDHWYIYNNIFYNNSTNPSYNYAAVNLPDDGGNSCFYNNTCFNNYNKTDSGNQTAAIAPRGNGDNVINNIFYNNGIGVGWGNIKDDSGTPDYNYVYPDDDGEIGNHAITTADPMFVDIDNKIVYLLEGSPCINAGTNLPSLFSNDFDGVIRPTDEWDLGAFEFVPEPVIFINCYLLLLMFYRARKFISMGIH